MKKRPQVHLKLENLWWFIYLLIQISRLIENIENIARLVVEV
jgi:hypothetical protein